MNFSPLHRMFVGIKILVKGWLFSISRGFKPWFSINSGITLKTIISVECLCMFLMSIFLCCICNNCVFLNCICCSVPDTCLLCNGFRLVWGYFCSILKRATHLIRLFLFNLNKIPVFEKLSIFFQINYSFFDHFLKVTFSSNIF